jgi:hypothetical protein
MIKSRRMIWPGMRNARQILVGKSEGKRPIGRPRLIREDNIRMNLKEIGWEVVDWIYVTQNRDKLKALVNTVMNLRVP